MEKSNNFTEKKSQVVCPTLQSNSASQVDTYVFVPFFVGVPVVWIWLLYCHTPICNLEC